jgi:predicted oxidoreductase
MKTQLIGKTGLVSTRLSYGCMRIAGGWEPEKVTAEDEKRGVTAVIAAWEAGYRLFDHADIYCDGVGETIFGKALKQVHGMRSQVLIATKCGIRWEGVPNPDSPHRYDFSAEHILKSCDDSLNRLGVETIDIYQLHRPDVLMDPSEVAGAFAKLAKAGKVRTFGVSNFLPSQVSALQAHLPIPLAVNQVEIHPGRLDCFTDGTLDQCLALNITPLSWSPLGGGKYGDGATAKAGDEKGASILKELDRAAKIYGVGRAAIVLAWLMKHPTGIIPIVGSANPDRIREAAKADGVAMSRDDWYRILLAARGKPLP